MVISAVQCNNCNCVIYSRHKDDYRCCECGLISVSGGQSNQVVMSTSSFAHSKTLPRKKITVDVTLDVLYDDFESGQDRFGLISGDSYEYSQSEIPQP